MVNPRWRPEIANSRDTDKTVQQDKRQLFFADKSTDLTSVKTNYDNKGQSFNLAFGYRPLKNVISAPMTIRTRAQGGWGGKSLYITTSGFKVK